MSQGRLVSIHVTPEAGGTPEPRAAARVVPGGGLEGDRHGRSPAGEGWNRELTLISAEALEHLKQVGLPLAPGASRRQLVTQGIDLDRWTGKRFRVGEVVLEGTKACRPCDHLEALTQPGVKAALEGRGGLCARIVSGGTLRVGDAVTPQEEPG
jgi:MOSC domain-containing protein YiiM